MPQVSADSVFADPPYGVGKADWDEKFPMAWLPLAANSAAFALAVTPGVANLPLLPFSIGQMMYRWTLCIRISNGMTRGVFGFGNWIPCLVYARPQVGLGCSAQDATEISINGDKAEHPSPKPYKAMEWIVDRLPGESIIDPFMGSGTTLLAAKNRNRRAIGIEIEEKYCEIAAKRLSQEVFQF